MKIKTLQNEIKDQKTKITFLKQQSELLDMELTKNLELTEKNTNMKSQMNKLEEETNKTKNNFNEKQLKLEQLEHNMKCEVDKLATMEKEYKKILHEKNYIQNQLQTTTEEKNLLEYENNKILMENSNLNQMVTDITIQFEKSQREISELKLEVFKKILISDFLFFL